MRKSYLNKIKANISIFARKNTSSLLDGTYHSIFKGKSLNFDDLREYVVGDNVKDIDWKASARCRKLLVKEYIADIIYTTRYPKGIIPDNLVDYISVGSSTRGAIAFMECSKAIALLSGRTYVVPDDIKALRYSVLRHRIALNFSAMADEVEVETIIDAIFGAIRTP